MNNVWSELKYKTYIKRWKKGEWNEGEWKGGKDQGDLEGDEQMNEYRKDGERERRGIKPGVDLFWLNCLLCIDQILQQK
jgi:hypothetical protein